jgi:hypothetical protein
MRLWLSLIAASRRLIWAFAWSRSPRVRDLSLQPQHVHLGHGSAGDQRLGHFQFARGQLQRPDRLGPTSPNLVQFLFALLELIARDLDAFLALLLAAFVQPHFLAEHDVGDRLKLGRDLERLAVHQRREPGGTRRRAASLARVSPRSARKRVGSTRTRTSPWSTI